MTFFFCIDVITVYVKPFNKELLSHPRHSQYHRAIGNISLLEKSIVQIPGIYK